MKSVHINPRVFAGLALVLLLFGCSSPAEDGSFVGYVEVEWTYVSAPQSGWLVSRPVEKGQQVSIGDVLFVLDNEQQKARYDAAAERVKQSAAQALDIASGARPPEIRELQARFDEAEAQFEQARLEKDRIERLVERNLEPKSRGDAARASYAAARARVAAATQSIKVAQQAGREAARDAAEAAIGSAEAARTEAQWALDQRTTMARVGGRIEDVFQYPGEYLTAGAPVLAIRTAESLKIRFFVPQNKLPMIAIGQTVQVKADGSAASLDATISFISDSAEFTPPVIYSVGSRDKLVFMIEARILDDENLHPGLPVDVSL